jgi:hypothetical protein
MFDKLYYSHIRKTNRNTHNKKLINENQKDGGKKDDNKGNGVRTNYK